MQAPREPHAPPDPPAASAQASPAAGAAPVPAVSPCGPPAREQAGADAPVPDVSVVIVTYNVREFLEQALESVARASAGLSVETFVVDNDSADGSAAMVRARFPHVRLTQNGANVGFAAANNQALREARGRYALVLNPDTILQEDTLRRLVAFMDAHPRAGAVGPRILNPDGTFAPESRRAFPTPAVAFYRISGLSRLFPQSPTFGRYNLTFLPRDQPCEVDALSGSCMMVRREALDRAFGAGAPEGTGAGLLDEGFFMYGEDLDWCYRMQQAGWTIHYTPSTQIIHYKGESTKKGDLRYVVLFYGAMLRFVEKHLAGRGAGGPAQRLGARALALGLRSGIVLRAGAAALGRVGRGLAGPSLEAALALSALALAAALWSRADGFAFGEAFYGLVLPLYALVLVAAVAVCGGYRRDRSRRAVLAGAGLAFAAVATASFLVTAIAFSRAVLLLGYAGAALALLARRTWRRRRGPGPRRTLVVGSAAEALRLRGLLARGAEHPGLGAEALVGHVGDARGAEAAVPHLGHPRQLRDLARLHGATDVVFAAESLSNTAILDGMRALAGLPVQARILAAGHDRIIGKASIEDFSAPLVPAERVVARLRPPSRRLVVDIPLALAGLALAWAVRLALCVGPTPRLRGLAARLSPLPDVLRGRLALVGYDAGGPHPPSAWGLRPGAFSILDTLAERPATITDAHRAYWFYARHQSAGLDAEIVRRALARP